MRASAVLPIWIVVLCVVVASASAQDALGRIDATVLLPQPTSNCSPGTLYRNDDGSIESAYSWHLSGCQPPYYGAWAEAYDLGPGNVACGSYWFTTNDYYEGRPIDLYVWDGGVTREPEGVIYLQSGVVPTNAPRWPECGENRFVINRDVVGEFTLGYWGDFSQGARHEFFICADEDGPGGHPWTCIAPGIGYPTGWHHVNTVFPHCVSLFIGPLFNPRDPAGVDEYPEGGPPAESPTWGRIKAVFRD